MGPHNVHISLIDILPFAIHLAGGKNEGRWDECMTNLNNMVFINIYLIHCYKQAHCRRPYRKKWLFVDTKRTDDSFLYQTQGGRDGDSISGK